MSTPSEPEAATVRGGDDEHRLHPLSWLFVLLQQLRSFAIPLILLLVTGRGNTTEWFGLLGVVGLTVVSVAQYFTYRYQTGEDGLVVRRGVLQRTSRDIPYERIHTVNLHQTLLHRFFGVTEVRLESAGSKEAEAVMRVLSVAEARSLESLIRERGAQRRAGVTAPETPADAADVTLLTLGTADIVRLGVISNRGLVVVAAAFGALWQFTGQDQVRISSDTLPPALLTTFRDTRDFVTAHLHDTVALAGLALVLLVILLVTVRLLSVGLALLQFHGFRLVEAGRQLRIERGLLTRIRNQLPLRRIQAWRIDESLLHRWFGRQSLRVDSAAGGESDEQGVRQLAPIATPDTVRTLRERLLPDSDWPQCDWHPVDPRAWRRMFVVPSLLVVAGAAAAFWFYGAQALLLLILLPLLIVRARGLARFAGYAVGARTIAVRSGWLNRAWGLAEIRKLQALRLTQSPFDRRMGMATLWFDTAGASSSDGVLRIRFLPEPEARAIHDRIAGQLDEERAATRAAPAESDGAGSSPVPTPTYESTRRRP